MSTALPGNENRVAIFKVRQSSCVDFVSKGARSHDKSITGRTIESIDIIRDSPFLANELCGCQGAGPVRCWKQTDHVLTFSSSSARMPFVFFTSFRPHPSLRRRSLNCRKMIHFRSFHLPAPVNFIVLREMEQFRLFGSEWGYPLARVMYPACLPSEKNFLSYALGTRLVPPPCPCRGGFRECFPALPVTQSNHKVYNHRLVLEPAGSNLKQGSIADRFPPLAAMEIWVLASWTTMLAASVSASFNTWRLAGATRAVVKEHAPWMHILTTLGKIVTIVGLTVRLVTAVPLAPTVTEWKMGECLPCTASQVPIGSNWDENRCQTKCHTYPEHAFNMLLQLAAMCLMLSYGHWTGMILHQDSPLHLTSRSGPEPPYGAPVIRTKGGCRRHRKSDEKKANYA
ncbi:hypothetical protein U1Q18_044738 [Sarracenia purpurea var. burkii]